MKKEVSLPHPVYEVPSDNVLPAQGYHTPQWVATAKYGEKMEWRREKENQLNLGGRSEEPFSRAISSITNFTLSYFRWNSHPHSII
jgi:hypothetical protein